MSSGPLRLAPEAVRTIRDEVARAGGREVSFVAEVTPERVVQNPRAVARGNRQAVLAAARDADPGGIVIHNHPSGSTEPSDADLNVAARLHEQGLGSAIVDNGAGNFYVVVEPPQPRRIEPLDVDALEALLAPGGPLSAVPGYEDRRGQRKMLRFVADRFNEGGTGLVEAGTGTGKSMAYLVPAARWAARNRERTVVSTNTINLQEQLVGKDIALAEQLLGEKVHWALVKGRANYVSIRRAKLAAQSAPELFADDRSQETKAVLEWLETTEDGSRSDLPFTPSPDVWDEVRSDGDACLRAKCPHFQECHYQRSRRSAAAADLLVVNHALFFSDLAVRIASDNFGDAAVLPAYARVVFDEAHHMEDAATTHLGVETTRAGLYAALSRLDRGGSDRGKGVLAALDAAVGQATPGREIGRWLKERLAERTAPRIQEARDALNEFFALIEPWVRKKGGQGSVRLGAGPGMEPAEDAGIDESLARALAGMTDTRNELGSLHERLESEDELGEVVEGRLLDLQGCDRRLEHAARALRRCLLPRSGADGDWVRWLEPRSSRGAHGGPAVLNVAFAAAPVDPGPMLADHLFENAKTAVLTSATMTANGSFRYVRERLGLARRAPAVAEAVVESPFDYASQSCLVVPSGMPAPWGAQEGANHRAAAQVVHDVALISRGGLFALFTSFKALRAVAKALREMDGEWSWPLFVQGEGRRSRLLRGFTEAGDGVLLGTASFWEGVDVPGRPLRALVLHKLPFRVPTDPLVEARSEALEARGRNAFADFMVPDAAIRLKQGVGRLIRRRTDRGAVVLLDDRILFKRYGQAILDTLPPMPRVTGPWEEARVQVARFYE